MSTPVESIPKEEWLRGCGCAAPCNTVHDADLDDLERLFPDDNEERWRAFRYGLPSGDLLQGSLPTTRVGMSDAEVAQLGDIVAAYEASPAPEALSKS